MKTDQNTSSNEQPKWRPLEPGETKEPGDSLQATHLGTMWHTRRPRPTPDPEWRPLEPGEIIQEGDQCNGTENDSGWLTVSVSVGTLVRNPDVLRFRTRRPRPAQDPAPAAPTLAQTIQKMADAPGVYPEARALLRAATEQASPATPEPGEGAGGGDLPTVEARISHQIMLYAERRAPERMNQFSVEDIIRAQLNKEATPDGGGDQQTWTPAEREAIDRLKVEKDMSEPAIIRQALRLYQMEHERQMGRAVDLGPKHEAGGGDQYEWVCQKCGQRGVPATHVTYQETHDGDCGGDCVAEPVAGGGDQQTFGELAESERKLMGEAIHGQAGNDSAMPDRPQSHGVRVPDSPLQQTAREWAQERVIRIHDDLDQECDIVEAKDAFTLADRADRAEAERKGWRDSFIKAQDDCAKVAAEFPDLDWTYIFDLIEPIRAIKAERDALLTEIGAWRCTVEAREAERDALREAYDKSIRFIKELNATKEQHGRQYRSRCGQFLAAALNQTNTDEK